MNVSSAPVDPAPVPHMPNIHSGAVPAQMPVTIAPSRRELRRVDPSLSFQVAAPGIGFFDVIVATDPNLFFADHAHMRTPRNFRSSRQDFEGLPIDIETGFYMLPRAFIRETISQEPRPTRLHYVAVAYSDETATDGVYSTHPDSFDVAPYVVLGSDLTAKSLSHVLGMAVHSLGAVNAQGRVMSAASPEQGARLPRMIGGLPVGPARRPNTDQAVVRDPARVPPGVTASPRVPVAVRPDEPHVASPTPIERSQPQIPIADAPPPPDTTPGPVKAATDFVDDDYVYGTDTDPAPADFRDFDEVPGGSTQIDDAYDDGLGPMGDMTAMPEPLPAEGEPVPELDEVPPPSNRPTPKAPAPVPPKQAPAPQAADWQDALVAAVIHEGAGGRYEALNLDGAFRGRMGPDHPYHQRAHDGLSIGPHQANQDSGELGELLQLMRVADTATFNHTFGPAADELITVTTAQGLTSLDSPDGRGIRLRPVEGADLWEAPWVDRFRAAVKHPPFQQAMRTQIIARRLEPVLPIAEAIGFERRGLAMLLSLALLQGPGQAIVMARAAVNPFDTPAKLAAVLEALGAETLQAFQAAQGLPSSDTIDDATHIALLSGLRALGADAPVPMADPETAMDMLVTTAGPGPAGDALLKLRVSGNFRSSANG